MNNEYNQSNHKVLTSVRLVLQALSTQGRNVVHDRETIIERLKEVELWTELEGELHIYLSNAIISKDFQYIEALLKAGANPNTKDDLDCYIQHYLHEYQVEKTTKGDLIFFCLHFW